MISLELKRVSSTPGIPTFGVLLHNHIPFAVTLERPWYGNARSESCIPLGGYRCLRCRNSPDYNFKDSPKFGDTFQVYNVPDRQLILFHKGNIVDDTHGCIIVGEQFGVLNGDLAVLASGPAFQEFMRLLSDVDEFHLSITNHYSGSYVRHS